MASVSKNNNVILLSALLGMSIFYNFLLGSILVLHHKDTKNTVKAATSSELLIIPWHFIGNKVFLEKSIPVSFADLQRKDTVRITYNLHGLCMLNGPASSLFFKETRTGNTYAVSLADYGKNCYDGDQTITIPLGQFGITADTRIDSLHATFWYETTYRIDITSIITYNSVLGATTIRRRFMRRKSSPQAKPTATLITPVITPGIQQAIHTTWSIQSVSSMKLTKDAVCNQPTVDYITHWVDAAKELGVNYVSVETPYDNPECGNAVAYTKTWVDIIRSRGLHVWHRSMPLAFEGIYNTQKNPNYDYITMITNYIKTNPSLYQYDDIFTPIEEPQNGGINGVTYCSGGICMFNNAASFNQWLRTAMTSASTAFSSIGLAGKIKIGYFGFDGYVTWGDNNPDWHGILEDATVALMGNITIDHYPEAVGDTMQNDLNELQAKYPNTPIVIGEWGTITGGNVQQQVLNSMGAAKRKNVAGFNYWHLGPGGNEALITDTFSHTTQFNTVQSFYKSTQ